ncbi:MAG: tetratricopeptide repeat protein [Candidatus Eisenbacteria bacterium]|nr:tetratricopeptide repeat protein [Candidatus Latescibacterota bacterium]MBD3301464.1 tetratricopeptide repeat protein [Candidatus Eisenbacteria bacterium]
MSRPRRKLALWKRVVFPIVPAVLLLLLLEGALALFGVRPQIEREDPFVGFVSRVPLFVEETGRPGGPTMATAANKQNLFNVQRFPKSKPADAYRIFCLGGSTTYGRPYADATSFAGWLRALLPAVDPDRRYEVVNAGGISYASYRIGELMNELVRYEPDLFVVYTGHNEFLEERTYGEIRRTPAAYKELFLALSRTRIWAASRRIAERLRPSPETPRDPESLLPREVQAKLDRSAGPSIYERDDAQRRKILAHYRFSLERIVEMARGAGAEALLVVPASKLRDCTPFKSQHTAGLNEEERARSEALLAAARERLQADDPKEALVLLDQALALDPRHADLHYRRGMALFALDRYEEADSSLRRARAEDVCPLRAFDAMQEIVREVAREKEVPLVDFPDLVASVTAQERGHAIPGDELFLDHVHPTIHGHGLLAEAILEELVAAGELRPERDLDRRVFDRIAARIHGGISPETHALALANLALTLDWAGKEEESRTLARKALESGAEDPTILMIVARHAAKEGREEEALGYFLRSLRANPGSPVVHSQLGMLQAGRGDLEAAAAHFYLAGLIWEDNDVYHQQLATIQARRDRPEMALASLLKARSLKPNDARIEQRIRRLRAKLDRPEEVTVPGFEVTRHPSGRPRTICQTRPGENGDAVRHGIWTEWFDTGELRRFVDYVGGAPDGPGSAWNREGERVDPTVAAQSP